MTMDYILSQHFGCSKAFLKKPKKVVNSDGDSVDKWTTTAGDNAYSKLVELLYDVGQLAEVDMNDIVETLDEIIDGKGVY